MNKLRLRLLLTTLLVMTVITVAVADNKGKHLYEAADQAYAQQNYQQAANLAKQALPLCRKTEMEADCLNVLSIAFLL